MNTIRPLTTALTLLLTMALLAVIHWLTTASAFAEQFPPGQPPWFSYGDKYNKQNNPYDHNNPYNDRPSFANGNAGYAGSELPPSEYRPDPSPFAPTREDRSDFRTMPPLDNGMYSRDANPWCSGEYCGR
jgi:hypothetical protein